jgi:DNA-binding response OmpR family regulator
MVRAGAHRKQAFVARQNFRPLIILHVEDDDDDALLMEKACARANLPVVLKRVPDGEQAKSYLNGEAQFADRVRYPMPHVVVLDLKLPSISGFDFLQWFRQRSDFASMQVLVFTSSLSRDDKSRAMAEGANSYFVKPASFEALVQIVEKFQLPGGLSAP